VSDLIEFLLARLGEDEEMASAAAGLGASRRHWTREYISCVVDATGGDLIVYGEGTPTSAQADHIARHDPDRVLAEADAKRRIVDWLAAHAAFDMPAAKAQAASREEWYLVTLARTTLKLLALPYASHPEYRQEWVP
jgi:hypothetical protein